MLSGTRARQGQVADRDVVAGDDEQPLTHACLVGNDNTRASAFYKEIVGAPYRTIDVLAGRNRDVITVLGYSCRPEGIANGLPGPTSNFAVRAGAAAATCGGAMGVTGD